MIHLPIRSIRQFNLCRCLWAPPDSQSFDGITILFFPLYNIPAARIIIYTKRSMVGYCVEWFVIQCCNVYQWHVLRYVSFVYIQIHTSILGFPLLVSHQSSNIYRITKRLGRLVSITSLRRLEYRNELRAVVRFWFSTKQWGVVQASKTVSVIHSNANNSKADEPWKKQ